MVCFLIISPALRVALSMALIRAPCSEAAFSSSAGDLDRDVLWQQRREDRLFVRLVFIDHAIAGGGCGGDRQLRRDQPQRRRNLRNDGAEAREEQGADVEFTRLEHRDDALADRVGVLVAQSLHGSKIDDIDDLAAELTPQDVGALLADAEDLDRLALPNEPNRVVTGETRRWTS